MKTHELCTKNCYGCTACAMICPVNAIIMVENEKGFLYPQINESLCVNCGMCQKVCSVPVKQSGSQYAYIAKLKDDTSRQMSQSGGVFVAISNVVLERGGTVYGAVLTDKFEVEHMRATTYAERDKMRHSKYAQSAMHDIYGCVEKDLEEGMVLFSGTPCQVAGLKRYLHCRGKNTDNLLTIDLICHGVPSIKIWRDLIQYYENKRGERVKAVVFRDNSVKGWSGHYSTFLFSDKQISDFYHRKLFYSNLALRESCYICEFAKMERISDFTIGDAWGVQTHNPEFYDSKGVSIMLLHTDKAAKLFEDAVNELDVISVSAETYKQGQMEYPPFPHRSIEEFWRDYNGKGFRYIIEKYAKNNIFFNKKYILKNWKKLFSRYLKIS
ncbi:MAG: Coenzyme F420 hydrogenase/dehydrogenase, beta subunit C-terminal domain [Bacteroidales bacterium]|nr:Coenzyme F420 hydrogenase/dehydrogenase, beta subunit C-terminal domain [Lachnoclostridium sp.]MCM1384119.1 Coenzyme F420 hydrogenase/dehydrogenase, beta subunit C-terminal domain [Lachnoclostridium sp.]MCM1465679.1 Coenzyme F420 hydrogenase/dehydrogenase, beta subunit C-terminal domain [Bacteroidales bacterium]